MKKDYLFQRITEIFSDLPKGTILDLGCGDGRYGAELAAKGFRVHAADMDHGRFRYHGQIDFKHCDLSHPLPFENGTFDYVLFLETIEHLKNPFSVMDEISRVLKPEGVLILSTPNILNIGSRFRFLFDGSFDFFREPLLDYSKFHQDNLHNMHIVVWRYQELEWLLFESGLQTEDAYADFHKPQLKVLAFFVAPFLRMRAFFKQRRALRKGGVDYRRIDGVIHTDALLLGRHLIIKARKKQKK